MTLTTHPVSLHVIRGALEFGGFKVQRIRTLRPAGDGSKNALYRVTFQEQRFENAQFHSPYRVKKAATQCFAADVLVTDVQYVGGRWSIEVETNVNADFETPWEVDDPEASVTTPDGPTDA